MEAKGGRMKSKTTILWILSAAIIIIAVITNYRFPSQQANSSTARRPTYFFQKEASYIIKVSSDSPQQMPGTDVEWHGNTFTVTYLKGSHEDLHNGFTGAYLVVNSNGSTTSQSVEGKTPAEYTVTGKAVSCSFQRKNVANPLEKFRVEILRDGQIVAQSETSANFGMVTAATK